MNSLASGALRATTTFLVLTLTLSACDFGSSSVGPIQNISGDVEFVHFEFDDELMREAHEIQQRLEQREARLRETSVLEKGGDGDRPGDPWIEYVSAPRPALRFTTRDQLELALVALDLTARAGTAPLRIHRRYKQLVETTVQEFASPEEISLLNHRGQIIVADTLYTLSADFATYRVRSLLTGAEQEHVVERVPAAASAPAPGDGISVGTMGKTYYEIWGCGGGHGNWLNEFGQYKDVTVCAAVITYRKGWPVRRYYVRGKSQILAGYHPDGAGYRLEMTSSNGYNKNYGYHRMTVHFRNKAYDLLGRLIDDTCSPKTATYISHDDNYIGNDNNRNHVQCGGFTSGKNEGAMVYLLQEVDKKLVKTPNADW